MPDEEVEQREEFPENEPEEFEAEEPEYGRRRYFTRRNAGISFGLIALILVLLSLFTVVFYRYGVLDNYVKTQFVAKMADIGIVFDADVFRVTVNPLELELKNATFNDKLTGERLFFIRDARLGLSVTNLYAWQLSRDISVDSTEITGAEVWITFDEQGRSNFANLNFLEEEPGARVNFKYQSIKFALREGVVHFGDLSRKIAADANNIVFLLEPESMEVPDEQKRYKFDFTSTDSNFTYDESRLEQIDVRAAGIADRLGAEIGELKIETPIGVSVLNGTVTDWASPKYNLNVESTVDLTQTSNIFPLGATLRGVGNFKGTVSGQGESYRVEGAVESEALSADGVYLRGVNVAATVAGTNSMYEANGKAIAELLTFEDFRVDFPQLVGNVRGNGTDFTWFGELQAAAAKSKSLTLGRLFVSDATAEFKDRQLTARAGSGRLARFSVADTEFTNLLAGNLRFTYREGISEFSALNGRAATLTSKQYSLQDVSGKNLKVRDREGRTEVEMSGLRALSGRIADARLRNVTADTFSLVDLPSATDIRAGNLRAERVDANGATITGLSAPEVTLHDVPNGDTKVYSDHLRVASVDASGAVLGSVNIAGVRLTIRQGTVRGTSNDIDAGNVALKRSESLPDGGNLQAVKIVKPVFVLEPSGRYRVTADMSLGGGVLGSVNLGAARATVDVNNDRIALNNLNASVMEGDVQGTAVIAFNDRTRSNIDAVFRNLDLGKLLALQSGRVIPLEGRTTGQVNLSFFGTSLRSATGTAKADIEATAGTADRGVVPVNGRVELTASNGLFNVDYAKLNSPSSEVNATGVFDLRNDNSNLNIALRSSDGSEIDRLIRTLGLSPDLESQMDSMNVQLAGNVSFDGRVTGNLNDPTIDGRASLDSISMRGRELGSVTSDILVSPAGTELRNGRLLERDGGTIAFNVSIPSIGTNNTSVQATLTNVDAANLLAALPLEGYLPQSVRDFSGQTSGTVNITGLPNNASGGIDLASTGGTVSGQSFDNFRAKATFQGTLITLDTLEFRTPEGFVAAKGTYDRSTTLFDLDVEGKNVQIASLRPLIPNAESMPNVGGTVDFTAKATGQTNRSSTYNIAFNGTGRGVTINESSLGDVLIRGTTADQILNADITATIEGRPQVVAATVNFGDENLPFRVEHNLDNSPLAPFIAFVPQLRDLGITGNATGRVEFSGNLTELDQQGNRSFTTANLSGTARFTQLSLMIQETPLVAAEPVSIRFSPRRVEFDSARFAGGGSNMTVSGTYALADTELHNLSVDGRVNLSLVNLFTKNSDAFFSGFADVAIRIAGPTETARVSGTANVDNGSVSVFFGSDRLTFERIKTRVIFTADQAQIDEARGFLGGGPFVASGGALLEGLKIQRFRLSLTGSNITVPFPQDFITTGDAQLEITGRRLPAIDELSMRVSGRVAARRSLYTKDIDLASIVGARREGSLSSGSSLTAPQFDLIIEGRDALIVRNNIADLTASVSLRLTGDADNPSVSGRIVATRGTILFRNDRYEVQRGVLEFPPDTAIEPIINLQAETQIAGYQIFVNLSGPLTDTELLNASVRSTPALPQADVVSLITTGNLSNTESGIPTLAQTGINTAADILTDAIISNPARKATEKLFGLNVFEIDPIISGERLNPSARLTVGRQINNNLRITYSTNLSQDQNQVLALEYRVSNKLSFVAQYEQRSLSNVTRNRDNFSFEIRFRRRF